MLDDLIGLGMRAAARRELLYPEAVVTYCAESTRGNPDHCITPEWRAGMTGVEYLAMLAHTRLEASAHVAVDWRKTGLKVAQIALHFGADDFGYAEDREEDIRRLIRDAGFTAKRRDPDFRILYVR